jgi:hypothetical protein
MEKARLYTHVLVQLLRKHTHKFSTTFAEHLCGLYKQMHKTSTATTYTQPSTSGFLSEAQGKKCALVSIQQK